VDDEFTKSFMAIINVSLQHHTPSVRKEAENLFIELYRTLSHQIENMLVKQKPAVVEKLLKTAKKETGQVVRSDSQKMEEKKAAASYISNQIKSDFLPEMIVNLLGKDT
jgi:hypothetical protein